METKGMEISVVPTSGVEAYRTSTDAAGLCREIVMKTAMEIQGRQHVRVEGWQAIAIAHGCTIGAEDVREVTGGVSAKGVVRRMSDGMILATAEGFVGEDEPTWYGGEMLVWDKQARKKMPKQMPPRPSYAIRAMAQTRAISRAGRSAFAHVVVMIDANLSTTPAEEVPFEGFDDEPKATIKPVEQHTDTKSLISECNATYKKIHELGASTIEMYDWLQGLPKLPEKKIIEGLDRLKKILKTTQEKTNGK